MGLGAAGEFAWVEADPTTPGARRPAPGRGNRARGRAGRRDLPRCRTWLAGAVDGLDRGIVVLVDYAEEPASLYAARRRDGTLRGFARHGVGGDPFRHVGRQDLTATVDLAAVRDAAARAGLVPLGETTQAEMLAATSGDLAAATLHRPGATIEDALHLRSALARLLDPRGMGGYRVLAFGRGLPAGVELASLRRLAARGG